MTKDIQIRNITDFSFREEEGARFLEGLIPYNKRSLKLPFYEYIERTAFNKTLADGFDVKALYGHDYNNVLGRVFRSHKAIEEPLLCPISSNPLHARLALAIGFFRI